MYKFHPAHLSRNKEIALDVLGGEAITSVARRNDISKTRTTQIVFKAAWIVWPEFAEPLIDSERLRVKDLMVKRDGLIRLIKNLL